MPELEQYEVTFRNKDTSDLVSCWSVFYMADSFGHAEKQAKLEDIQSDDEIIKIERG